MNKKQNEGITLVALVITIIVLIILAGVSINAIINDGLIKNSKIAKDTYSEAQTEEIINLAYYAALAKGNGSVNLANLNEQLAKNGLTATANDDGTFGIVANEMVYNVHSNGSITKFKKGSWVQETVDGTITIKNQNDSTKTFAVGDIVTYGEQTAVTQVTVTRQESGRINNTAVTEDQVVAKKALTWKVLGADNYGRLLLISTEYANPINIYGKAGGENATKLIDDVYNKFYGNAQKGTIARGIKSEDIEYQDGFVWYTSGLMIEGTAFICVNEYEWVYNTPTEMNPQESWLGPVLWQFQGEPLLVHCGPLREYLCPFGTETGAINEECRDLDVEANFAVVVVLGADDIPVKV